MVKEFFKELFRDMLKQACAVILWSSLVMAIDGAYGANVDKKCDYSSWWHYHPMRMFVCKVLESKE